MKDFFTLLVAKCISLAGKVVGRGSVAPGDFVIKFNIEMMKKFKLPAKVVFVTGSSGKGSTSSIIAESLRLDGFTVAFNSMGSNISPAIFSTLISNCNLKREVRADYLVLEIDERYCKEIFHIIKPTHVVVTNITRDQPPRQGHTDFIYSEIERALTPDMHLILNGDDPMLVKLNMDNRFKCTYYGIDKNKFSYKINKFKALNMVYCPRCDSKLNYKFYHFEVCGDFSCKCGFTRPKIDYLATDINFSDKSMVLGDQKINLVDNTLYHVSNTISSLCAISVVGGSLRSAISVLESKDNNKAHHDVLKYKGRIVDILNTKAENAGTYNSALLYIDRYKDKKTILIGLKEISRRYKFDDMSWLYDIEFDLLKNQEIDKVVLVGICNYDLANRLKYVGIDESKIYMFDTISAAHPFLVNKTKGDIYGILDFYFMEELGNLLRSDLNDN